MVAVLCGTRYVRPLLHQWPLFLLSNIKIVKFYPPPTHKWDWWYFPVSSSARRKRSRERELNHLNLHAVVDTYGCLSGSIRISIDPRRSSERLYLGQFVIR